MLAVEPDPVQCVADKRKDSYSFDGPARGLKAAHERDQKVSKQETHSDINGGVKRGAREVEPEKIIQRHPHASRQRRCHGIDSGNELGEQQRGLAALIERFGGPQDAGFGVDREFAEKAQQSPSHVSPAHEEEGIAQQHREYRQQ